MFETTQRVLMTADAIGGVWTYALELAAGLAANGVDVLLAVMGGEVTEAKLDLAAAISGLTLAVSGYKLEWMRDPWDDVAEAGDWLLGLADRFRPDVVHLNGFVHAALPWSAPVLAVAHSCVLSWFAEVRGRAAGPEWDRYRDAVRRGLQSAHLVIAPSRAMLHSLALHYGPLPSGQVIYNGRSLAPESAESKQPIVFSAGRIWDDAKNFTTLSQAAPDIGWPVMIAGDDTHPEGSRRSLTNLQHLGLLTPPEMDRRYRLASIYALPAVYEPFGYTALEAAGRNCALVLSDIPSLREIWGQAAVFAAPRRPGSWADAINGLIADPDRRRSLAHAARLRASELTAARMTQQYFIAYNQARILRSSCVSPSSATRSVPTGIMATPTSSAA